MRHTLPSQAPTEAEKVAFLSAPGSYPHGPADVQVVQTHMSWVFLAGDLVYKLKKPLRTTFLDFSTLSHREAAVTEELRLNRRLTEGVYLGARALRVAPDGGLTLEEDGPVADWMVEMRRLPEGRTLSALIDEGKASRHHIARVADLLVDFYRGLPPEPLAASDYAERFLHEHEKTARVLNDPSIGLEGPRSAAALCGFEKAFDAVRGLLEERASSGRIVEGHGDLRPEHVFLTEPPAIIDSLEFNRGLRQVDPFDEIAFLGLECARMGADWAMPELRDRLETGLNDRPDLALLTFYWRYRALLRTRLALLHLAAPVVRHPHKWRPLAWHYLDLADEAEARIGSG